jgi:hypothetical protein
MPRTKRSRLQKAQSAGNLSHLNSGNKENSPPSVSPASEPAAVSQHTLEATELELKHHKVRGQEYERRYRLEVRKNRRTQGKNSSLLAETSQAKQSLAETQAHLQRALAVERKLRKEKDALRKRRDRVPEQQSKAVSKAVQKATTHQLQEKGAVSAASRGMVRKLVQLSVPVANISSVVKAVNDSAGVTTNGLISRRTASWIVLEGGVASKVQLVDEIRAADSKCEFSYDYSSVLCCLLGIALSGDGTTHKV